MFQKVTLADVDMTTQLHRKLGLETDKCDIQEPAGRGAMNISGKLKSSVSFLPRNYRAAFMRVCGISQRVSPCIVARSSPDTYEQYEVLGNYDVVARDHAFWG